MGKITRQLLKDIRKDIDEALVDTAKKYGIDINCGSGSYGELEGSMKLIFSTTNEEGESQEAVDFRNYAHFDDLNPDWLYQTFSHGNDTYKIIGYKRKARKNNILLERLSDNSIRITEAKLVAYAMNRQ